MQISLCCRCLELERTLCVGLERTRPAQSSQRRAGIDRERYTRGGAAPRGQRINRYRAGRFGTARASASGRYRDTGVFG